MVNQLQKPTLKMINVMVFYEKYLNDQLRKKENFIDDKFSGIW